MKNIYFIHLLQLSLVARKNRLSGMYAVLMPTTCLHEQRKTDWLENESLVDFLDPQDNSKTIEVIRSKKSGNFS